MSGWTWSLLAYVGVWIVLNLLAWWIASVEVGDTPAVWQATHQSGELFLAMPDEVLLLDAADESASMRVSREVSRMNFDCHEVRHA